MNDLSRRPSGNLTRAQRERRAYTLVLATGATGVATVVVLALAIFGVGSVGLAFLLALVTAAFGFMLRRTLSP